MYLNRRLFISLLILLSVSASLRLDTLAQVRPINDHGAMGLSQQLRRLSTTASVMMIGAHPDDEDSALLAYLARGENARTAYLSLTRGDGGQNIIGPELFEPLGIIRTEELLQARRLDGAEQYFARAFDYGFSKTLDEAKSKWPEEVIKCDVVRAIRSFRPLVVISRFSGTSADGHGQHQYSGYISPIAVKAAGDWDQCKGAGDPWQVAKFYASQSFNSTSTGGLRLNTGRFDAILGRSYFEVAIEGRSQHRSQGEGRIEFKGEQFSTLNLKNVEPVPAETSPFDRLDTTIVGVAQQTNNNEEPFKGKLIELQKQIDNVRAKYRVESPADIAADLANIYKAAVDAQWSTRNPRSKDMMRDVQRKAIEAFRLAAGIQFDVLADKESVSPGDNLTVTARAYVGNLAKGAISVKETKVSLPKGWTIVDKPEPTPSPGGGPFRRESGLFNGNYEITIAKDAKISEPYWLRTERRGEIFDWPNTDEQTLPFSPQDVVATTMFIIGGVEVPISQSLQFRFADPSRGEIRRNVNVVPAMSVEVDRSVLLIPRGSAIQKRTLNFRLINNRSVAVKASLAKVAPSLPAISLKFPIEEIEIPANGSRSVDVEFTMPGELNSPPFDLAFEANSGGTSFHSRLNSVAYPHITTHRYYTRSNVKVVPVNILAEKRNIGYIMGSGDEIPEAIRQIGMTVTMLEEKDLASGDLAKYDTIVVGVRATETRPDMLANKARLLDYVRNGGNLVVQYQRGQFANSGLTPFPVTTTATTRTAAGAIARVVDENAKVTILQPQHPFFTTPNAITDKDFEGWVQERNAYNLVTFDSQYMPLLESHDAGEGDNNGGLVTANVGKGTWTYCSYSFFRQLPAGVPGAYRLFANLLSQPRGK